jgi:hypothetical protein
MHGDGLNNSVVNAGEVYIFSGKKLSAKLGKLIVVDPLPAPQITSATLTLNGQPVQQANAGQNGLRIIIGGFNLGPNTEVTINGTAVVSHFNAANPPTITVNLDENPAIKNSAGQLILRARNTNPDSGQSNQFAAGRLVGLEISSVSIKKKKTKTILKISGSNFPSNGTVEVLADAQVVPLKNTSFERSDFVEVKIRPRDVPPPGAILRVKIIAANGTQSNVVLVTVP